MVKSYLELTIKFHDYSSFFTAFDVASERAQRGKYLYLLFNQHLNYSMCMA